MLKYNPTNKGAMQANENGRWVEAKEVQATIDTLVSVLPNRRALLNCAKLDLNIQDMHLTKEQRRILIEVLT